MSSGLTPPKYVCQFDIEECHILSNNRVYLDGLINIAYVFILKTVPCKRGLKRKETKLNVVLNIGFHHCSFSGIK